MNTQNAFELFWVSSLNLTGLSSPRWFNLLPAEPGNCCPEEQQTSLDTKTQQGIEDLSIPVVINFLVSLFRMQGTVLITVNNAGTWEMPLVPSRPA